MATSLADPPAKPMMAIVLPQSSCPVTRVQRPAAVAFASKTRLRTAASMSANVCSATVVWLTPGVKSTGTLSSVAAARSILSRPMPYFEITFSLGSDRAMTARVSASSPHK